MASPEESVDGVDNAEDDQLASMSTEDVVRASRLINNEIRLVEEWRKVLPLRSGGFAVLCDKCGYALLWFSDCCRHAHVPLRPSRARTVPRPAEANDLHRESSTSGEPCPSNLADPPQASPEEGMMWDLRERMKSQMMKSIRSLLCKLEAGILMFVIPILLGHLLN